MSSNKRRAKAAPSKASPTETFKREIVDVLRSFDTSREPTAAALVSAMIAECELPEPAIPPRFSVEISVSVEYLHRANNRWLSINERASHLASAIMGVARAAAAFVDEKDFAAPDGAALKGK